MSIEAATAVVSAAVALLGLVGYQGRRARLLAIHVAFRDAVDALAAPDRERQLAGAILLRRFFDPTSEFGIRGLTGRRAPYAHDAMAVMAAVLRGLPAGDLQKLLADGLAHAPTLERADLQGTNLQGAYLSPRRPHASLARADFFRADLGSATLKNADARDAVFYQARLRRTVFRNAHLEGANFFEADVGEANFAGAHLLGASFAGARDVPPELLSSIDADGRYTSDAPAPGPRRDGQEAAPLVFVSAPALKAPQQEAACARIVELLERRGARIERLTRTEYPPANALSEIYRRMAGCRGVLVIGLRPQDTDTPSPVGATAWVHAEAGMAFALRLPMLILREEGVRAGVFDDTVVGPSTEIHDLGPTWREEDLLAIVDRWVASLR